MPQAPLNRIFIVGSSGNVGRATVDALATRHGDNTDIEIFAGVRDPDSDKAQALAHDGRVQVVKADSEWGRDKSCAPASSSVARPIADTGLLH